MNVRVAAIEPNRIQGRGTALVAAVLSWPLFFLLRTNLLNADGHMLTPKFERDVPLFGAHVTHDEMLEFLVHSRIWYYTHQWWGWSVVFSYQVVSCVAGSLFVYALVRVAPRLAPAGTWMFLAGMASGGYMQLFFGDVENYTMTAALVVVYILTSCRFLAREVGLWVPALTLAIALCFHLEAGWLLPSAVYLLWHSRQRTGDLREGWRSAAIASAVVALVLAYLHFHGLPVWRFFSSHAGHALRADGVFAFGMPASYFADQARLLLLLCPAIVLLPLALVWRPKPTDEITTFLAVAAASMLSMQVVWKSQIGVFDDWNLYAIGGMLAAMFIWRWVARTAVTWPMRIAALAVVGIGSIQTYAWIVANHFHGL